jgi:hypothetical protein
MKKVSGSGVSSQAHWMPKKIKQWKLTRMAARRMAVAARRTAVAARRMAAHHMAVAAARRMAVAAHHMVVAARHMAVAARRMAADVAAAPRRTGRSSLTKTKKKKTRDFCPAEKNSRSTKNKKKQTNKQKRISAPLSPIETYWYVSQFSQFAHDAISDTLHCLRPQNRLAREKEKRKKKKKKLFPLSVLLPSRRVDNGKARERFVLRRVRIGRWGQWRWKVRALGYVLLLCCDCGGGGSPSGRSKKKKVRPAWDCAFLREKKEKKKKKKKR